MTQIGSPPVPSTVVSSLETPVARNDAAPDDGAHTARLASPAIPASLAAATPSHATPAEVDQSALPPQVPPLPCAAVQPRASAAAASLFAPSTTDIHHSCPLSLRGDPGGARAFFGSGQGRWMEPSDCGPSKSDQS